MSAKAANAETKTGILAKIKRYFKDMRGELKEGCRPEKKQVLNNTGIVIVFLIISACIICGLRLRYHQTGIAVLHGSVRLISSVPTQFQKTMTCLRNELMARRVL